MSAMRLYMRALSVDGVRDEAIATRVGMTGQMIEDMYKIMAIADYEDRFAIPTAHREQHEHGAEIRGGCGFTDGNGCSTGETGKTTLFGGKKKPLALAKEVF
jgi:nitrate reductase beta subunit